jgi:hypothetical protein
MGAEQSSTRDNKEGGQGGDETQVKACYYEILDVDRQATEEE